MVTIIFTHFINNKEQPKKSLDTLIVYFYKGRILWILVK